jgi:hypothetical protein
MFTILQGYYNWIDQLWEGNMLHSPSQEALTDPIVPILGFSCFSTMNTCAHPQKESILVKVQEASQGNTLSLHHSVLDILTPDYTILITP